MMHAAVDAIDPEGDFDAVINVQGDMPFADPGLATACAAILHGEPDCDIATLVAPELDASDRANPDVVKAVLALAESERQGRALYFTRSTLYGDAPIWRHIGVYGYRREALKRFCAAPPSPLEKREKLEQLRALEMGMQIWARVIDAAPLSVDNPADLEAARRCAAFLALPTHADLGLKLAWESADHLWRWAGDTATDWNHYSKRTILSGILIPALTMRWFDGREAAEAFVDRRIDNVMTFEKWKAGKDFDAPFRKMTDALSRMRYGARA